MSIVSTILALAIVQQADTLESRFPYIRPPTGIHNENFTIDRTRPDPAKRMILINIENDDFKLSVVIQNPLGKTSAIRASDIEWRKTNLRGRASSLPKIQIQTNSPIESKPMELGKNRAIMGGTRKSYLVSVTNPTTSLNQDIAIQIESRSMRVTPMPARFDLRDSLSETDDLRIAQVKVLPAGKAHKTDEVFDANSGALRSSLAQAKANNSAPSRMKTPISTRILEVGSKAVAEIKKAQAQRLAGIQ